MEFKAPEKKHIYIRRNEGRYNLLSSDTMVQYSFHFPDVRKEWIKDMKLHTFYNLKMDEDCGWEDYTPLECAYEIKAVLDGYWMNSSKDDINNLVEYLESIEEDQEVLRQEYGIEYAKAKIEYWREKFKQLMSEKE